MGPSAFRFAGAVVAAICLLAPPRAHAAQPDPEQTQFRVCADPNNLPFSNEQGQGFENKLAEFVAGKLNKPVAYAWWAQRRGFVRNTLKARLCDVVMGVPTHLDMLATTRPYYRSTYVFLSRADRGLDVRDITDPRLHTLRIGVQLIGNDGFNTPPAHALGEQGIVDNVVGFSIYGDYRNANPAAMIVQAVEQGSVDIAAVWGPFAGYFARTSPVPLVVAPIADTTRFAPLRFQFDISMGVRKDDHALKAELDDVIARGQPEIDNLLRSFGVPLVRTDAPPVQPASLKAPAK
jgi:quinoprotein dehydrogenase-associated probable ABC transporter substrate-binding protein